MKGKGGVDWSVGSVVGPCLIDIVASVFADCAIKTVTLPDSLTSLGIWAFKEHVEVGPPTHPLIVQKSRFFTIRMDKTLM